MYTIVNCFTCTGYLQNHKKTKKPTDHTNTHPRCDKLYIYKLEHNFVIILVSKLNFHWINIQFNNLVFQSHGIIFAFNYYLPLRKSVALEFLIYFTRKNIEPVWLKLSSGFWKKESKEFTACNSILVFMRIL